MLIELLSAKDYSDFKNFENDKTVRHEHKNMLIRREKDIAKRNINEQG